MRAAMLEPLRSSSDDGVLKGRGAEMLLTPGELEAGARGQIEIQLPIVDTPTTLTLTNGVLPHVTLTC